jgi:ribonuclease BN (tRNA processing enzyme)
VAAEAGVRKLVLSHFVPPEDPLITEQTWRDAVATHYPGPIVVGADLMSIEIESPSR